MSIKGMIGAYLAEDWHMIMELKKNGMSISGIARNMGISRKTVRKYLSAVRIYEELKEKGYPGSYTTVNDLCRNLRKQRFIMADYRYETEPGKQSQMDFSEFGCIDLEGKKRLYSFSIILGYSGMRYAECTADI